MDEVEDLVRFDNSKLTSYLRKLALRDQLQQSTDSLTSQIHLIESKLKSDMQEFIIQNQNAITDKINSVTKYFDDLNSKLAMELEKQSKAIKDNS